MDYHQRNGDDDCSILTFSQPLNSASLSSSATSILDSVSKTSSLLISKQSNINIDRPTRSFRKRRYRQQNHIESSHSITTTSTSPSINISKERKKKISKKVSKVQRQEARPLGTCVRKCDLCRQLKHILLVECTICFRMMDIDLKDCKCQIRRNHNIIHNFICSICNSELTLDGYIICANRTCQTTLSALLNKENMNEYQQKTILSTNLSNICYPKAAFRTVAVQINTLMNLSPLQRFLPTIIDEENEELSSLSWSKHDSEWTRNISSTSSSHTSHLSTDSEADISFNNIARNLTAGFNSNQPTKLALQSEDESQARHPTSTNSSLESNEMPKSPRCLAIMNAQKRHDRLSSLLTLQTNKISQTQLSCLTNTDEMIKSEELQNTSIIQTKNPSKTERQIQVDTIKGRFDDLCQVQIEIADRIEKNPTTSLLNEDRVLQALTDKDGQRWSEFVDQLINEKSHLLPSEIAQALLNIIGSLNTAQKLNNLTAGQLQRKIRYAMSQFKHIDENSYLQNSFKTAKTNHSKRNSECSGRVDMAVTVRQIDNHHHHHRRQSVASSDQNWKPYVDRLFEQGHSADEIQRLLREAAVANMQSDDQRLQDVFNYINTKTSSETPTKPVTRPLSSVSEKEMISNESSPVIHNKDQSSKTEAIKKKPSSPSTSIIESNVAQAKSSEDTSVTNLNNDEKERKLSLHLSTDKKSVETVTNPSAVTTNKHQSKTSTDTATHEQKSSQILELVKSKTSQPSATFSFENPKSSSTIPTTSSDKSTDIPLSKSFEERSRHALPHAQNTVDPTDNLDVNQHSRSSDIQSELNKPTDIVESNLQKSDSINPDNTELRNKEEKDIPSQMKQLHFQNLNEKISNTLNILQEHKKIVTPSTTNQEFSSFHRLVSDTITISSEAPVPSERIIDDIERTIQPQFQPIQSSLNTTLDLKHPPIRLEYQETAGLIQCRPIAYTSSTEKRSTETLQQVLVHSTEHVSSKTKELDKQPMKNKSDSNHVSNVSSKTDSKVNDSQSQTKWLNSLLSKLSDNASSTSVISSAVSSVTKLNQTKIDGNIKRDKEEPIVAKSKDKQVSSPSNHSTLSHPNSINIHEVNEDSQQTPYETDIAILKEEHLLPRLIPEQVFPTSGKQFQVTEAKLLQKKSTSSSKQALKSNESPQSSKIENNIEEFAVQKLDSDHKKYNNELQSTSSQSTVPSSVDVSHSFDQHEYTVSTSDEKISPIIASEDTPVSKIDMDTVPETSIESSSSKNSEEKKRTASIVSSPSNENKDRNSIKTTESHTNTEKTSDSSHVNAQILDEHAFIPTSNYKNDSNKLQTPVSSQKVNTSNTIKSNSVLTNLHDPFDIASSIESISKNDSASNINNQLSSGSDNQSIVPVPVHDNEGEELSNKLTDSTTDNEFYTPTMLSPERFNAEQPANTILSPSPTAKIENAKYKKSAIPSPSSLLRTASSKASDHVGSNVKHDIDPHVTMTESSGNSKLKNTVDNKNDEEKPDRSVSNANELSIESENKSIVDSSTPSAASVQKPGQFGTDDTSMKSSELTSGNIKSSNDLRSTTPSIENQSNEIQMKRIDKRNSSSSKESNPGANRDNTTASEHLTTKHDKSEESSSIYSSLQTEQSYQDKDSPSKKKSSLKSDSMIKPLASNKQSTVDNDSETKDVLNESSNTEQVDTSSSLRERSRPIMSTTTAVLPSSITNVHTSQQDLKPKKLSEENQGPISVSSFNLAHLTDLPSGSRDETEGEKLPSQLGKKLSNPMPKLLLKRSSIKQSSVTAQPTKPSVTSSITDISASSSNTLAADHFPSTHSTVSDHEEIKLLKKPNKRNKFLPPSDSIDKYKTLPKSSDNQANKKQRPLKTLKKKFKDNSLVTNSEFLYDTELNSDASQIIIIDDSDEKKLKQIKNKIRDRSQVLPFNLKARDDHQGYTIDSSRLPSIEQSYGKHPIKKWSNTPFRRPIIRLPVTQIEKFPCGTIGPHPHPSSIAHQLFYLPSLHNDHQHDYLSSQFNQTVPSVTDRFYSLLSSETSDDPQAFESIVNWQQYQIPPKIEKTKYQYMYLLDSTTGNPVRGKQYPIITDEIDMIDDPNACTIVNKWAFADLVNAEREKFIQESTVNKNTKPKKQLKLNKNIKICLLKRPLTQFEEDIFKEVDIISLVDSQTILLHIPSITVDNQVFIKNRKYKCDQTFDENCQLNTIYQSTLAPLLDLSINGSKCLCLIGGGRYSGKTYLLRSLIDFLSSDLTKLLPTYNIHIKLLGICHNRIVDLLQNYSPIRLIKSTNSSLVPNDEYHIGNNDDMNYIKCQIKKRRRFLHQLIEINIRENDQSVVQGSLMIVILASSQYVYTRNLCSHRKKFLINSLNRTMLAFKRALLGIRQNPDRIRTAFNNDILTRLIQPYIFDERSNVCYIGTLNPGHRHRTATKSTVEFARNLRFCLKRINKQRRKRKKLSQINTNHNEIF